MITLIVCVFDKSNRFKKKVKNFLKQGFMFAKKMQGLNFWASNNLVEKMISSLALSVVCKIGVLDLIKKSRERTYFPCACVFRLAWSVPRSSHLLLTPESVQSAITRNQTFDLFIFFILQPPVFFGLFTRVLSFFYLSVFSGVFVHNFCCSSFDWPLTKWRQVSL